MKQIVCFDLGWVYRHSLTRPSALARRRKILVTGSFEILLLATKCKKIFFLGPSSALSLGVKKILSISQNFLRAIHNANKKHKLFFPLIFSNCFNSELRNLCSPLKLLLKLSTSYQIHEKVLFQSSKLTLYTFIPSHPYLHPSSFWSSFWKMFLPDDLWQKTYVYWLLPVSQMTIGFTLKIFFIFPFSFPDNVTRVLEISNK